MTDTNMPIIEYFEFDFEKLNREGFSDMPSDVVQVMKNINRKIAAQESLEDVMNYLFDATKEISLGDRIGLSFIEENGDKITAHWARSTYDPLLLKKGYSEDLYGSSLQKVIKEGKVRIINDLQLYLDENPDSNSTRILVREGVRSSMTCPLYVEGRPIALLFRSSREPKTFNKSEVMKHLFIAERLSQAIDKAWRLEQLSLANKSYFEMLGFVSHELKSPLASIVYDSQTLIDGYLGELNQEQKTKIGKIVGKSQYLIDLIREYLDLARIETGELELNVKKDIDFIKEIVEPAIDIAQAQIDAKKMYLIRNYPEKPVLITCDPDLLKIVMVNLIGNGIKYAFDSAQLCINITPNNDKLHVSVWNEGPGFPRDQRPKLFRKFSRVDTPELKKVKGTGVGLYTCWRIINLHLGKMNAISEQNKWAEFMFDIPLTH